MKLAAKTKFRNSLLARYVFIILIALCIWPLVFPVGSLIYYMQSQLFFPEEFNIYDSRNLEKAWHQEANDLDKAAADAVDAKLRALKEQYPRASMFWVDASGRLQLKLGVTVAIPEQWTMADSMQFMKSSYGGDPFTVVAFIGQDPKQGFMVVQIPRHMMESEVIYPSNERFLTVFMLSVFSFFLFTSWLFFARIRKRLLRFQIAMTETDESGIPQPITVKRVDEIGQLGLAFNHMIDQLNSARRREQEEEALRKQLIANLSHDLRTPLTTIRGHAYSLRKEALTPKGKQSLDLIESKVDNVAQLIENLMSYTLLSAGKYPLRNARTDVLRLCRTSVASWYPVFEKEGFDVDVRLPEAALYWNVDPQWFTRILDNLFQNIVRHANSGKYVCVRTEERHGTTAVVIADKGPGIHAESDNKGAGIGLTIVALMIKDMILKQDIVSSRDGTAIYMYPKI